MVNTTTVVEEGQEEIQLNGTCPLPDEGENSTASVTENGDFNWDHATQGIILSSFYYGYICTQFIGGYLSRVIGAKILFGLGIGGTAALTLLNPVAASVSPDLLVAIRVIEGFLEGFAFPSSHHLLSHWAPRAERTLLVSFPYGGQVVGTILANLLTGLLCQYGFAGGWPSAFYVFGSVGALWTIGWFYFISETPAKHPTISPEEREYIEKNCQSSNKVAAFADVPWRPMFTSPAVIAVLVGHTAFTWNFITLLTEVPTYLSDVLHIGNALNGVLTSLLYVCMFVVQVLAAFLADWLLFKGLKTKYLRKIYFCGGLGASAICLVIVSNVGCNATAVVALLCISVGLSGFALCGYMVNNVDIAPQYASIIMGVSNTFASLPGIISPIITGNIINQASTIATWQTVFLMASGISMAGAVIFGVFADGEVQRWAKVKIKSEAKELLASNELATSKHYDAIEEHDDDTEPLLSDRIAP